MHHKTHRVVVPLSEDKGSAKSNKEFVIDVSQLRGKTLEKDLRQRDFTINSMAAPLDDVVRHLEDTWPPMREPCLGDRMGEFYGINKVIDAGDLLRLSEK